MHLVTVTEPLKGNVPLPVGAYLADNVNAGQLLANNRTSVQVQHVSNPAPLSALTLDPAKAHRLLVIRPGGFGDLLFLTPCLPRAETVLPPAPHRRQRLP